MRILAALAALSAVLTGCTDMRREAASIEQAPAGKPYNFVVHVNNVSDYGYNPLVSEDRGRVALRLLKGQCPAARVIGQDTINTEIYGLTSSKPDYIVLIRCMG
jgi:hypothetical protein